MEFSGEFETHLTVSLESSLGLDALQTWGLTRGLKCLHIVLERGNVTSQPMLTRRGRGEFSSELAMATDLARQLEADGFAVTRIKIEAAPFNQGVPQTDAAAAEEPRDRYFEHHIKLLLELDFDVSGLRELAERHSPGLFELLWLDGEEKPGCIQKSK